LDTDVSMSSIDAPSPIVSPRAIQRPTVIVGLAALAALALTLVPGLGLLSYPFRLLITIVHELSHGLVALLTGGAFLRFVVFPNGEGVAYTAGGWRLLVIPAGYLGSALFGASLIYLGRSVRWGRTAMAVLGAAVLLLSLRYGLPSVATAQWSSGVITVVAGLVIGAGFLWVARKATTAWVLFLINLVAIQAGLTAFSDLFALINLSSQLAGAPANDARAISELTLVPALIWAVLWALVALALVGTALWRTWFVPKRSI
jgi:peptidase M50B-like protein